MRIIIRILLIAIMLEPTTAVYFGYPRTELNPQGDPLPTQEAFHQSKKKYRLLAGGFGSGKTTTLCIEVIKEISISNNYGLLGRKDLSELKSTTLKELLEIIPEGMVATHNKTDRFIKFINGSELYYMNLDDAREASEKIKSLNLGFVAIDQLEEIQEIVFLAMQGRLRRLNSSRNFFATCNPAGHDWIWSKWKNDPPSDNYELFESITLENKYLPKDYVDELLNYPERWVKRYVYCSWDDFEGIVFNEFIEAKHKIPIYAPKPEEQQIHVLDYGFRNPTCILFAATDYDGITRIYDEYYESEQLISHISNEYKKNVWWKKAQKLADPSINKVERDGQNVNSEFQRYGVNWIGADNDVIQGINHVNELFKRDQLLVCENCTNTLREIGSYKWRSIKPGQERNDYEEPIKKDDHAMDCTRYLANHIYAPPKPSEDIYQKYPWMNKLKKKPRYSTSAMSQ